MFYSNKLEIDFHAVYTDQTKDWWPMISPWGLAFEVKPGFPKGMIEQHHCLLMMCHFEHCNTLFLGCWIQTFHDNQLLILYNVCKQS